MKKLSSEKDVTLGISEVDNGLFNSSEDYDINRLTEKLQEIEYQKKHELSGTKVVHALKSGAKFARGKTIHGAINIGSSLEPKFLKRKRKIQINNEIISRIETEEKKSIADRDNHQQAFVQNKKQEQTIQKVTRKKIQYNTLTSTFAQELKQKNKFDEREQHVREFIKRQEEESARKIKYLKEKKKKDAEEAKASEKERLKESERYWIEKKCEFLKDAEKWRERADCYLREVYFMQKKDSSPAQSRQYSLQNDAFTESIHETGWQNYTSVFRVSENNARTSTSNDEDHQVSLFYPPILSESEKRRYVSTFHKDLIFYQDFLKRY